MSGSIMHENMSLLGYARQDSSNNANSPLKLFTHAKTTINEIFKGIASYVNDANKYLDDVVKSDRNLITNEKYYELQQLRDRVNRILSIISRDHMKVVFFGRTSNGKSTTMNAMLRERILPVGMGHTTNCFLQIEGTDKAEPYMLVPDSDEPKNVSTLGSIGSALSRERLDSDALVKILWPKEKCRLIRDDVVLVDSPGIDVSANLDQWIENHCLDADVFVLVISAEATITVAEKKFLHNVAQRLSNPNIFILMNRWDATANEPEMVESVRQQHLERGLEFLCDELKICNREEAKEHRMFFISAREALLKRNKDVTSSPRTGFAEGHEQRLEEFTKFEREFEECISKTAVQTKFQQHTNRGKEIITSLRETTATIAIQSQTYKDESVKKLQELDERSIRLDRDLKALTEVAKEKIRHVSDDVYRRVSQTLNDEIKRLYSLIEDFDRPFSSDVEQIPLYKRDLHRWVEDRLGSNLQSRLNSALHSSLDTVHSEIKERVKKSLVDPKRRSDIDSISPRSDFSVTYALDCSNLCSDFREDIQFKFSLGLPTLWQRFVQTQNDRLLESKSNNELPSSTSLISTTNDLLTTANQISRLSSGSGLILLGATAVVWKSIGWRVVGVVAGLYGGLYLYERLLWTKKAQERAFKRQYADYASAKMKAVVNMTSSNASTQVQQELSMYFAQSMRYVDAERDDIEDSMKQARIEIDQFLKFIDKGKKLKKQGDQYDQDLSDFSKKYLSANE